MLQSLYIQNYALIDKLDIEFNTGFSVITGETGAGKSIILGALGLLLGQRADNRSIGQMGPKCVIEAVFDVSDSDLKRFFEDIATDYDKDCIVRREILSSGKSRAFINDSPASLVQLKALGERLIDIHSQHQNLLLNKEGFQLRVLDILSNNQDCRHTYTLLYEQWRSLEEELKQLEEQDRANREDEDYIRFQLDQLQDMRLKSGEQDELEQKAAMLEHAKEIKESLYHTEMLMETNENAILSSLKECVNTLNRLEKVLPSVHPLLERITNAYIELKDICQEISSLNDHVTHDPDKLEEVNNRLNRIYALLQKHHLNNSDELIQLSNSYRDRLNGITSLSERIDSLKKERNAIYGQLMTQAHKLTQTRQQAAHEMEQQLMAKLALIGMPHVCFKVEIEVCNTPSAHGVDKISYLFSANKNTPLQNIASVASGGETARIMLVIKSMMAGATNLPTIVFDEIDTGVSGKTADRMADIMKEMGSDGRQVISITHLPQIAARGKTHYKVYKTDTEKGTNTSIVRLNNNDRELEIARMLSGSSLTEAALNNARALLMEGRKGS